jgi:HlyD family secretion protein
LKIGQKVKVSCDFGADKMKDYGGTVAWISSKAEFTPKTIETRDERANLVYAVKIYVKNDGTLKIGMYGNVKFN